MCENPPAWLPDMISTGGQWDKVLARLYAIFARDFKNGSPRLWRKLIWWNTKVKDGETYEEGFWHLIERKNTDVDERQFDPRRSERLAWCRAVIDNYFDNEILVWEYKESRGAIRTYLWLLKCDYVVIFQKKVTRKYGDVYHLVTAYYVDGASSRRTLRRKHENMEL